jgi:hypothetical protein
MIKAELYEVPMELIKPNPFRGIQKYPIDESRVKDLIASMEATGVWPNIIGRWKKEVGGVVQIAYGHHRWIAAKKRREKNMHISILPLSNAEMLHIMANENMTSWSHSVKVVNQTIRAVKTFLDKEFKKAKNINKLPERLSKITVLGSNGDITEIGDFSEKAYQILRSKGAGRMVILGFLGEPWKAWQIADALKNLEMIDEGYFDEKSLSEATSLGATTELRKMAKDLERYGKKKEEIKEVMKEVVKIAKEEDIGKRGLRDARSSIPYTRDIVDVIKRDVKEYKDIRDPKKKEQKPLPDLDGFVSSKVVNRCDQADASIRQVMNDIQHLRNPTSLRWLKRSINALLSNLIKLYIKIEGVEKLQEVVSKNLPKQLK